MNIHSLLDPLKTRPKLLLAAFVTVAIFGAAPNFLGKYEVDSVLDTFLIYVILAESYDIMGGLMGYVALGITVFYAAGAYLFAIPYYLMRWNLLEAFLVSTLITALIGLLVSFPMFRLKGFYFAVATLALLPLGGYIVTDPSLFNLTGGVGGVSGIVVVSYQDAYYAILGFAVFTVALIYVISKSKLGLALTSIREDEQIAESSGINTWLLKKVAMTTSATLCGFAGCLFAWSQGSVVPSSIFSFNTAFIPVTFALFGGTGTILGPILGSGVYSIIDYVVRSTFIQGSSIYWISGYESAIIGIFLIIVGLFAPGGIMQLRKPLTKFFFGEQSTKAKKLDVSESHHS
ncbi:MAG: branched-chain amino acid ABC transporter permease [archaeon]|nr:branched-chain amino acid ABC transporter permease [archaeon]